ncbi:MAG: ribonuclease H-like domain-containing protein [Firmicutes bacterium]|nr:ribonuclease H-like domain-containing protein [Bacillota bacterium]MDD4263356.1 ribonuclease H-like domain-containing protein [Bacillota bacterium]
MSSSSRGLAVFPEGEEVTNEWGSCWVFTYDVDLAIPHLREFYELDCYLQAVRGIGPVREEKLNSEGVYTISGLVKTCKNESLLEDASLAYRAISNKDWPTIFKRFPKFTVLGSVPRDKIAVVDIETSGFGFAMPIFLVGILTLNPAPLVKLFLARHPAEEPAMLQQASSELSDKLAVITYNGASFDLPVMTKRCIRSDVAFTKPLNLDLLPIVRRLLGKEVPDCKLKTIEKLILKYERDKDPASSEIPAIYQQFFMEQDPSVLTDVISHNKVDLESLIKIWSYLDERDRNNGF